MAKLTNEQWAQLRSDWEASPKQGIEWLSREHGGPWDITAEAIRRKRIKDGEAGEAWAKPVNMGEVARKARLLADAATSSLVPGRLPPVGNLEPAESIERALGVGEAPPAQPVGGDTEAAAVDVRSRLIETHRREWRVARGLAVRAVQEAQVAKGFDVARYAKMLTEILTAIQNGERRAWGLDADMLDLGKMTDAQLQAIAEGKAPR